MPFCRRGMIAGTADRQEERSAFVKGAPSLGPEGEAVPQHWGGCVLSFEAVRISCILLASEDRGSPIGERRGRSLPEPKDRQAFDVPRQGWRPARSNSPLSADNHLAPVRLLRPWWPIPPSNQRGVQLANAAVKSCRQMVSETRVGFGVRLANVAGDAHDRNRRSILSQDRRARHAAENALGGVGDNGAAIVLHLAAEPLALAIKGQQLGRGFPSHVGYPQRCDIFHQRFIGGQNRSRRLRRRARPISLTLGSHSAMATALTWRQ